MSQRLNVIISSTSQDLEAYREKVASTVVTLDMFPITMASFHPSGTNPVQISYDKVQQADIFVGIYARRYGYIPDSTLKYKTVDGEIRTPDAKTSITHLEYLWAVERGLPLLLFVAKSDIDQFPELSKPDPDEAGNAAMDAFRAIILKQHVVGFFDTVDNLTAQAAIALSQVRNEILITTVRRPEVETRLVQLVETWWIKGALETSLHDKIHINLDFVVRTSNPFAHLYNNPTNAELEIAKQSNLLEVFKRFGERLLILGMPGSGKTITLLDMARQLIERARHQAEHRIPVIFNLSSWQKPLSIEQWLILELVGKYNLPTRDAQNLLTTNKLICLLDGLDEVEEEKRRGCLDALNAYITSFDASVVVCCRTNEYEALNEQLKVVGTVTVQPLTIAAVDQYLLELEGDFTQLKASLSRDDTLRAIILNPLMLYIAIVTQKSMSAEDLSKLSGEADWYEYLFNTYVSKILENKSEAERSSILTNLRWLAHKLFQQSRSIFYIDQMGIEMLDNRALELAIRGIIWTLYGGVALLTLLLALSIGYDLAYGGVWAVSPVVSIPTSFGIWLATWVSAGLLVSRISPEQVEIIVNRQWSNEKVTENMVSGIFWGAALGGIIGLIPTIPMTIITYVGFSLLEIHLFTIGVIAFGLSALVFTVLLLFAFQRVKRLGLWGGIVAGIVGGVVFAFFQITLLLSSRLPKQSKKS